jgi:hypothetical protein
VKGRSRFIYRELAEAVCPDLLECLQPNRSARGLELPDQPPQPTTTEAHSEEENHED